MRFTCEPNGNAFSEWEETCASWVWRDDGEYNRILFKIKVSFASEEARITEMEAMEQIRARETVYFHLRMWRDEILTVT